MYNIHLILLHREEWKAHFWPRDLKAYSVNPLLVQPTHYIGDKLYFSDTETSNIWEDVHERENGKDDNEKKGDPASDEDSLDEDDTDENHVRTPSVDPKKDGGRNTTEHAKEDTKEQNLEEAAIKSSIGQDKIEQNEKQAETNQQSASSTTEQSSSRKQDEL